MSDFLGVTGQVLVIILTLPARSKRLFLPYRPGLSVYSYPTGQV